MNKENNMRKSKLTRVLRCSSPGCRTLTAQGQCDKHRAEQAAAPVPNESAFDYAAWHRAQVSARQAAAEKEKSDARARELLAEAERGAKAARDARDQRSEELECLRRAASRADRAGEQPRFSHA
jgi:hypothetical protein